MSPFGNARAGIMPSMWRCTELCEILHQADGLQAVAATILAVAAIAGAVLFS